MNSATRKYFITTVLTAFSRIAALLICGIFTHTDISAQNQPVIQWLKGYFIVNTDSVILNGCSLNIESTSKFFKICGDYSFYKNISFISYVPSDNLVPDSIDIFEYQIQLQNKQRGIYLSTNSGILQNVAYVRKHSLENSFLRNTRTADTIQSRIERLHLDFSNGNRYNVLLSVTVKVISLPDRIKARGETDPFDVRQYAILFDPLNKIELVKLIKSPF